jgi:hypothetical protein
MLSRHYYGMDRRMDDLMAGLRDVDNKILDFFGN